jgi:hypothetical protein
MTRLFAATLCLAGAVLCAASAIAQTPVDRASKAPIRAGQLPAPSGQPLDVSEVPGELLDKMRAQLATEQGVNAGDVKVVSAQSVNWPNGALGCPKPGVMYTQAIVPGYRVELEAGGKRFTYHASTRGAIKRCEGRIQSLTPDATK